MDSGTAAVLGALIGGVVSPLTTWFSDFLRHRRSGRTDRIRRERLKTILNLPNRKFVALSSLARAVAADEKTTARLLLEIGARHSLRRSSTKWVLLSRAPFPGDAAADQDREEGEDQEPSS